jgi:hypothetical protein
MPSDVAHISEALFLPYWVWGLVTGGISIAVLVGGMRSFIRDTR